MKYLNKLNASVAFAAMGLALVATPAFADQAAATTTADAAPAPASTDVIIVTGSVSKNPATATASPVVAISADSLADRGITSVADALQLTPANNSGTLANSWSVFGFATGASAPSLRGFNDGYTLTIFNGLRSAIYPLADDGYRNFVDINTIPESIVDNVQILQDGASAAYGADAVAGVVNVIIKKEIQGLHVNMSSGISQKGDAGEKRFDASWGIGSLKRDGYNFYINGEYQKNDAVKFSTRGTGQDLSHICDSQGDCLTNFAANGLQGDGSYLGFGSTTQGFARPWDAASGQGTGQFQNLNPSAGCGGLTAITLNASQATSNSPANGVVCQQDTAKQYDDYSPQIIRIGANARLTKDIGRAQFYLMFNYAETKTFSQSAPSPFTGSVNTIANSVNNVSNIVLPAYVCPGGVGGIDANGNSTTTCTASSAGAKLNPNNPYAAQGQSAQLSEIYNQPLQTLTDAKTYRVSGGISGTFGDGWAYDVEGTTSWINLGLTYQNYINAQDLLNAVAQGTYNFVDQNANSAAANAAIAPTINDVARSRETQFTGNINHDLFALPGGKANVAVGAEYRFESVNEPSVQFGDSNPYNGAYVINPVSVVGSRRVYSGFYEVTLPILDILKVKADGRYDSYSSGQHAFSPKFEATFKPIKQIELRGTYGKGFHIPTFSQLYGYPTTGYVGEPAPCPNPAYATFCSSHPNNSTYTTTPYSVGETSEGNPNLAPERSQSYTIGTVLRPDRRLTLTVDYWHTKIDGIIISVAQEGTPVEEAIAQYYANNGVVNVPGVTVTPGLKDPTNPNSLPLLGYITSSYVNAESEVASGIDIGADLRLTLSQKDNVGLHSIFNVSYLGKLTQTTPGGVEVFAGTLGPCNITACSGTPRWRGVWSNTFDIDHKTDITLTGNYTSGYSEYNADIGFAANWQTGPNAGKEVISNVHATFTADLDIRQKIDDHFTIYLDVKNVLNSKPVFDPAGGYGDGLTYYMFNPAWDDSNYIGRFFRVGAKIDF